MTARPHSRHRRLFLTVPAVVLLLASAFGGLYLYIAINGYKESPGQADAIVVLGASVAPGGNPTPALAARTELGVRLWKEGRAKMLVLTGGLGRNPPAEALVMREIALREGVPAETIVVEDQAHSTLESAQRVGEIAKQRGWSSVIVATDPFHTIRAGLMFQDRGLRVITAPTNDTYYSNETRTFYTVRETLALTVYFLQRLYLR
ncbi:MAG: YdcF family protein [Chloroflexi bacterium]|nr:YdcF family protein [Chloroflexota bacterium]